MRPFLILFALASALTIPQAQQSKNRVGYVNVVTLVRGVPNSKAYLDLNDKATKDLAARLQRIQRLTAEAGRNPTANQRLTITQAQNNYAKAQKDYQAQLQKAFQPLSKRIDAAISKTAAANGYSVLIDQQVAAKSGLIVYADKRVDLTQAVLKNLK